MTTIIIKSEPTNRAGHSGVCLSTCAKPLQAISDKAQLMGFDHQIIVGYRDPVAQLAAYRAGKSKLKPGHSKHNSMPSEAFDFIGHPFAGWTDIDQFRGGAHVFLGAAHILGIVARWGGDWNMNGSEADEHGLRDFDHIELM